MVSTDKLCFPGGGLIADIIPHLLVTKCGKSFQYSKTSWTITDIETTERDDGFMTKTYNLSGKLRKDPKYHLWFRISKCKGEQAWGVHGYKLTHDWGEIPF